MKKEICVFLADGFEEVEALTVVDLLRRAEVAVTMVSITGAYMVEGAHGIRIQADALFEEVDYSTKEMIVLPGGMPGTIHLEEHEGVTGLIQTFNQEQKYIAAICAAPRIFGRMGLLKDRKATSYPAMETELAEAEVVREPAVVSGHIITSRGLGTAIDFALTLISELLGKEKAAEIQQSVVYEK